MSHSEANALIALGANLPIGGNKPIQALSEAYEALCDRDLHVYNQSKIYKSPAFPAGSGPDYANSVAEIGHNLPVSDVLALLHEIEHDFGRKREGRWTARTLDLDLICQGHLVTPDAKTVRAWMDLTPGDQMHQTPSQLLLPHPRIQDRAFVLKPMCDIAADWRHPILGLTARQMLDALPDSEKDAVRPYDD